MAIIEVDHVTKEFRLGELESLARTLKRVIARIGGRRLREHAPFKALDDVDFSVEQGEVLGIIGQNGAGKSTLLKMLAGIAVPTRGRVTVGGAVAPLIELGAGMVPDLTGRENIVVNAAILGMRRREIAKKFDEIVSFAEIEEFIDTPIKRYSSGMKVRLGFSIATCLRSDILIIDEVLAVGDLAFQRKCFDRMEELIKREGKTVLLVSHNIRQVERLCDRVLLLDHGRVIAGGDPKDICDLFYERSDEGIKRQAGRAGGGITNAVADGSDTVKLLSASLVNESGAPIDRVVHGRYVSVMLVYESNRQLDRPTFGVGVHTTDLLYLATNHSDEVLQLHSVGPGVITVVFRIRSFPFLPGLYSLRAGIGAGEFGRAVFYAENVVQFQVGSQTVSRAQTRNEGFVTLEGNWEVAVGPGKILEPNGHGICQIPKDNVRPLRKGEKT